MRVTKLLSTFLMISLLTGCSWFNGEDFEPDIPEDQLYEEAISAITAGNNRLAIEKLQLLEARYPFGRYSEQSQLVEPDQPGPGFSQALHATPLTPSPR